MKHYALLFASSLTALASAAATVQGTCVQGDSGLSWLANQLSNYAVIACLGSPLQQYNVNRYWGKQIGKNASVVIFPTTANEVSYAVQATTKTPLGKDFAFVGGAHGMTGAATSDGYIIDLTYMNHSEIVHDYQLDGKTFTAIAYEGGCKWADVYDTTNGTGYTAVGARLGSIGVGGFSTGGGIGFLAGAYGYAIDRLRAMDVVLPDGSMVTATASNSYSDLFWALQGGGGQFGIVTKFYQEAAAEPSISEIHAFVVTNTSAQDALARENTVKWFRHNTDPFSLIYFVRGVLPADPANLDPSSFGLRTALITLRFQDPINSKQPSWNQTFDTLMEGLTTTGSLQAIIPFADMYEEFDPFFPYGFRRGFYGPQVTNITAPYLSSASSTFDTYIESIVLNGETPVSALWAIQYMYPGLNGNLPASDNATAWPHAIAGHQTLFSPAWSKAQDDPAMLITNSILNGLTHSQQTNNGPFIADYPNYISPGASGSRVWGSNVARLIAVKQKYDPNCCIHNGRTFASKGCLSGGWANIFP